MPRTNCFQKFLALFLAFALCASALTDPAVHAKEPEPKFEIFSEAAYLVNNETGRVIYEKNADKMLSPASLVTIMTAIIAIENCSDLEGTVVTAPTSIFDELYTLGAANVDIRHGEEVRMIDLLYAMILRSACEAASIIANYIGNGDNAVFVEMMNQKAQEIGAAHTHFTNPHGLPDDNQYTTAKDMYLITKYAMEMDPIFMTIASTDSYTLPATNKHAAERTINHTNSMMSESRGGAQYSPYVRGIKTGASNTGRNLVSTATKDAYSYTLVTLNAPRYYENGDEITDNQSFVDAKQLYTWAFDNYAIRTVMKTSTPQGEVKVELAKDKDVIPVYPAEDVTYLMHGDIDTSSIQRVPTLPESIDAPVAEGQILGTMEVKLDDVTIATVDLVAGETLERSSWLEFLRGVKGFFSSVWFKLAIVVVLLLIAAYIVFAILYNNRKRRRRKAKRRF